MKNLSRYARFLNSESFDSENTSAGKSLMDYSDVLNPNYEIYEPEVKILYKELASALEQNSVLKIKKLKKDFGDSENFAKAKKILNDKCKQIWSVYNENLKCVPVEAMKSLGISNQPDLDFLLRDSVKYFEKDGGNTTCEIISKTLDNKNITYDINDIHNYLVSMNKKERCNYNSNTIKYLIFEQNYNMEKLYAIGVNDYSLKEIANTFTLKQKFQFLFKYLKTEMKNFFSSVLINQ